MRCTSFPVLFVRRGAIQCPSPIFGTTATRSGVDSTFAVCQDVFSLRRTPYSPINWPSSKDLPRSDSARPAIQPVVVEQTRKTRRTDYYRILSTLGAGCALLNCLALLTRSSKIEDHQPRLKWQIRSTLHAVSQASANSVYRIITL